MMHPVDIFIALAILAAIAAVVYAVKHHKPPATPAGADLANTVVGAVGDSWDALKRDLPEIVSAELAQAKADLAAARQEAAGLAAKLAATVAAHNASLASVAARVSAAVTSAPELPPASLAAAVEAQLARRVDAYAEQISPAHSAQN